MKAVSITDRIKYLHCPGEDGQENGHGILVLLGADGKPMKVASIDDQADFRFWFRNYSMAVESQATKNLVAA